MCFFLCGDKKMKNKLLRSFIRFKRNIRKRPDKKITVPLRTWFLQENTPKKVLIIKTDHIGDYMLFRNFIYELKKSHKYRNCIVHFIGNEVFQEICELLDRDIIDKTFWVKHKLPSQPVKFIEKLKKRLIQEGLEDRYDLIFFPGFNRSYFERCYFRLIDGIFYKELVCDDGDVMSKNSSSTKLNGKYTRIIHLPRCYEIFDFDRNKRLLESVIEEPCSLKEPTLTWNKHSQETSPSIVITLFSRNDENRWHIFNYVALIKWLMKTYSYPIYVVGAVSDESLYNKYKDLFPEGIIPFFGKPWAQVLDLLANSCLYIGPDSGLYHISVLLNRKTVVISRGSALFRFCSYSKRPNLAYVFPIGIVKQIRDHQKQDETYIKTIYTSTNLVSVQQVKDAVQKVMRKNK